ncbi:hypothetical protein E2C01_008710 [Portunus trituberculatus]|uniref:Uncharacterized protein n=1 Tax=Portunus trituberculatus TaxID=210409 RepID=A0A5B7D1I6_PORTR|nr:hypothetical protein [Portunus trituberculatus]
MRYQEKEDHKATAIILDNRRFSPLVVEIRILRKGEAALDIRQSAWNNGGRQRYGKVPLMCGVPGRVQDQGAEREKRYCSFEVLRLPDSHLTLPGN